jgi:hypothetical protein
VPIANYDLQRATVIDFFSRMNNENVDYAVLRNYEFYPEFRHDIDLVVRWNELPHFISVAKSCAIDHGWSTLTKCDHWDRSPCREHTIQILRFYSVNPPQYLQIDAFHSHLVLGLPLYDEDAMLCDRIKDSRGFFRINEHVENFCRLLSIARLAGRKGAEEKIKRYSARALSFWENAPVLSAYSESLGFPNILTALDHLKAGDLRSFKKEIDRQKRAWLIRRVPLHPIRAFKMLFNRCGDYLRLFWLRPCGFDVRVFASDEEQRTRLEQILKKFTRDNIITIFTLSRNFRNRQIVRERGGIVVVWAPEHDADVSINSRADNDSVINALLTLLIERHPRLFDRRIAAN